jgi:hypothetical protein
VARIRTQDGSSSSPLPSRCLIGRSRACELCLATPETSSEHALLRWRSGAWELQDLGSLNGTYVDGRRLGAGLSVGLSVGVSLGFGHPDEYVLCDAGPPEPHAVGLEPPHLTVESHAGLLTLPDAEEPEVTVLHRDQTWWLERADGLAPIRDGELVMTGAGAWRLRLPEQVPPTRDAADIAPTLAALTLRFLVNGDGGPIKLVVLRGDRQLDLKTRAHQAPLLTLARARLGQQGLPGEEQGWVEQEELLHLLGCDTNRLHVDIHRIRRQFAAAGVIDAVHIVERRPGTRQLRVGVSRIEISTVA